MKNIVLGVTGSIAAYKAADLANILTKEGYNVDVILTHGGALLLGLFAFYGLFLAATEGVEKALVADLAPPDHRGLCAVGRVL